jgi:hypothetical protein
MNPRFAMIRPESSCRKFCFDFAIKPNFEIVVLIAICINTFSMCIKWPNMDQRITSTLEYAN